MMKKFFTVFALILALVLTCASCVKTDIPPPSPKGEEVEREALLEFYENVKKSQAENEISYLDAWYVITLEEVSHVVYANDQESKENNYISIDYYRPYNSSDLKYRATVSESSETLLNGESQSSRFKQGSIVGINGVAYLESYDVTLDEDADPTYTTKSADVIYSVFSGFSSITLESLCNGYSNLTQVAYLDLGDAISTLTVVYEYENADTKIEQTVIFEFDALTGAFQSLNVHACKQTVTESISGDDYTTEIVQFTCKTSIPLPVFEPDLENGNWANL